MRTNLRFIRDEIFCLSSCRKNDPFSSNEQKSEINSLSLVSRNELLKRYDIVREIFRIRQRLLLPFALFIKNCPIATLCKVKILDINVKKLSNDIHVWSTVYTYDAVKYKPIV